MPRKASTSKTDTLKKRRTAKKPALKKSGVDAAKKRKARRQRRKEVVAPPAPTIKDTRPIRVPKPPKVLSKLQKQVVEIARQRLRSEMVYTCASDDVESDEIIKRIGVPEAAEFVYRMTLYWLALFP